MKNIPDDYVRAVFDKVGEPPIPGNTRHRWGQQMQLTASRRVATFIATDVFALPTPLAVSLTFSVDGQIFSPIVPAVGNNLVEVDLIRGLDPQSSPVTDRHSLSAGDTQSFCGVIAQSLQVVVRLVGEPAEQMFVAVVVAPVTAIDCADILGPSSGFLGFDNAATLRLDADVVQSPFSGQIDASPLRKYIAIQNMADTALMIRLGAGAGWTPENGSIVLPPNINAIWEAPTPMYRGLITFSYAPGAAAVGYLLWTRGE